jgi:hypothetical protein
MKQLFLFILMGGIIHVTEVVASNPLFLHSSNEIHVDLIELNHNYNKMGQYVFSQVIFWERINATGEYRVRGWILVEEREALNRIPITSPNGITRVDFKDGGCITTIKSPLFKESAGILDPEKLDQAKLETRYRLAIPSHPWNRKIKLPE